MHQLQYRLHRGHVFNDLYMRCTVNPVTGHERFEGWVNLIPAKKRKKVMVVGAGPGGMEAARVAALRGTSDPTKKAASWRPGARPSRGGQGKLSLFLNIIHTR